MSNTSLNISLPKGLKEYVAERVAEDNYSTASDYIRALIREDRKRRAERKLEALLLEGLESGPAAEVTAADWEDIRRQVRRRLAARQKQGG
jgi:antitoxin ParD1/3/4